MTNYLALYRTILRTFGPRVRPLGTFGLLQLRRALDGSTRALDHLLFPEIRRTPIDRPVFILGNPRSGTTFLHRFLLQTDELAAFALWEMLFPAVTARKLLGGMVDRFAPFNPARYHSSAAHETSLTDVEADDAMTFFHFLDGGFLWSYFLAWEDEWGSELSRRMFHLDDQPLDEQERYFRFLEGCWRRNLVAKGKRRIIAKASTFTLRVRTLLRRYPDCKLIYMVRDPVETIPSGMSLITGVLENAYDMFNSTDGAKRARYLENLYQASCYLFQSFHDVWRSGAIPARNLRIVTYPRMMNDLEGTMRELVGFLEITPAPSFADRVRDQAAKQRAHRSEHHYSPEKFNLTADRIRRDLAYVYDWLGDTQP
ncbi:MAG TPA: sulfotransferase [Polyangia bacterium]